MKKGLTYLKITGWIYTKEVTSVICMQFPSKSYYIVKDKKYNDFLPETDFDEIIKREMIII